MTEYTFYEKPIQHSFLGDGTDTLIVQKGIIQAHVRTWHDPACTPGRRGVNSGLVGRPVKERGKGWRKLRKGSFAEEQMQHVAYDWIEVFFTSYDWPPATKRD